MVSIGCSEDEASTPLDIIPTGSLQIRVRNNSAQDCDRAVAGFPRNVVARFSVQELPIESRL